MKKNVVVLGLGNPLMGDEGIGCTVVERLLAMGGEYPRAEFLDAGTGGMNVLHLIADRQKAILIDCARMGEKPGTIVKFAPDDVKSVKKLFHQSLHEADLLNILELSKQLGQCPREVVIFGIEPERVELGENLSPSLSSRIDDYTAIVLREVAGSGPTQ